jgi:hypothetical protein
MAIFDKSTIVENIKREIVDNSSMLISPYDVRHNLLDMIDSAHVLLNNTTIATANFSTPPTRTTLGGDGALGKLSLAGYVSVDNSAFGYHALQNNYNGQRNTAVGSYSLSCSVWGSGNTAVGYTSLGGNVFGHSNVAIGNNSLQSNKFGNYNIAIGHGAGYYHGSGTSSAYSNKFYLGSHDTTSLDTCDIEEGVGPTPLMYGELDNLRLGIGVKTFHDYGNLQVAGTVSPSISGSFDLGHARYPWKSAFVEDGIYSNQDQFSIDDQIYISGGKLGLGTPSPSGLHGLVTVAGHVVPLSDRRYDLGALKLYWKNGYFKDLFVDTIEATTFNHITECLYECKTLYLATSGICVGEENPCGYLDDASLEGAGLVITASGDDPYGDNDYLRTYNWTFIPSGVVQTECLEDINVYSSSTWNSNISINIASGNHLQTDRVIGRETVSLLAESGCFGFFLRPDNEVVITGGITTRNEKQLIKHYANGGTFTLSFADPNLSTYTTEAIIWNATAAAVSLAITSAVTPMSSDSITVTDASVTGGVGWIVEFTGTGYAGVNVNQLVINPDNLTSGGSGSSDGQKFLVKMTGGAVNMTGAGCAVAHNYKSETTHTRLRVKHGTHVGDFYFEFTTDTPAGGGVVRTASLQSTMTLAEVAAAITYAVQNGRKANGDLDPDRAIPDFLCYVPNGNNTLITGEPGAEATDPTRKLTDLGGWSFSLYEVQLGHFSSTNPIRDLTSSSSVHELNIHEPAGFFALYPKGCSAVSWPAPVCAGGYKPGVQMYYSQYTGGQQHLFTVYFNSSDTAAEVQDKFDDKIGADKVVVTSAPYRYLKGDDAPAGSAYDPYRREDDHGELWPDDQRRDCLAITGLIFEYLDATVYTSASPDPGTYHLQEITRMPSSQADYGGLLPGQRPYNGKVRSRDDITPVIEINGEVYMLLTEFGVLNYSGTAAIGASVTTTQQGSPDVTTVEFFGEDNTTYLTREEFIKPNPLSPEGKIHNISDVNFLSSGTDYTVSYSALMSGVTVGQRLISRTSNKKKTDDKEHFYGFDINYKDKLDVVDSHNQKTDRLDISVYDDMTDPVNAFTVMRDYKGAGLVGITNMTTNPLPNTIFNIQSTGNAVARVTGGGGTYSRLQLLSGSNYIENADGLELEYENDAGNISLYKEGTKTVAISIDPLRQVGIDLAAPNAKLAINGDMSMSEFDQGRAASNLASFGKVFVTASDAPGECQKLIFQDDCGNQTNLVLNPSNPLETRSVYTDDLGNTVVGKGAGATRPYDTEDFNTAYGWKTLKSLNGGDYNTAIGALAGEVITAGLYNTLVGSKAGRAIVGGSKNIFLGYGAGEASIDPNISNNIVIGFDDIAFNMTTDYNFLLGHGKNNVLLEGKIGPDVGDMYFKVNESKFIISALDDVADLSFDHNLNFFGTDRVGSEIKHHDPLSAYPDGGIAFIFEGSDGIDNTLLSLRHHVAPISSTPTFFSPSPEVPYAELKGDLRLQGAIRFSNEKSIESSSDQINIGDTIRGDTANKRVVIGSYATTPTATLELKPATTTERIQEWKDSDGNVVAYMDQTGNLHIDGQIMVF